MRKTLIFTSIVSTLVLFSGAGLVQAQGTATGGTTTNQSIQVHSNPAGATFRMKATTGEVYEGHTPALFTNMQTGYYRVEYDILPDCEVQRRQERSLLHNDTLIFFADYNCGARPVNTSGRTPEELGTGNPDPVKTVTVPHFDRPGVAIMQTASPTETVPGGVVEFTVSMRNVTRSTLRDLFVTTAFDQGVLDIMLPVSEQGMVAGNMIEWIVPELYAGQVWTTTFRGRVPHNARPGDRIVLTARASGEDLDALYPQEWSSTTGVGIAYMPQTGWSLDFLALLVLAGGALLTTTSTILRKKHVVETVSQ